MMRTVPVAKICIRGKSHMRIHHSFDSIALRADTMATSAARKRINPRANESILFPEVHRANARNSRPRPALSAYSTKFRLVRRVPLATLRLNEHSTYFRMRRFKQLLQPAHDSLDIANANGVIEIQAERH